MQCVIRRCEISNLWQRSSPRTLMSYAETARMPAETLRQSKTPNVDDALLCPGVPCKTGLVLLSEKFPGPDSRETKRPSCQHTPVPYNLTAQAMPGASKQCLNCVAKTYELALWPLSVPLRERERRDPHLASKCDVSPSVMWSSRGRYTVHDSGEANNSAGVAPQI